MTSIIPAQHWGPFLWGYIHTMALIDDAFDDVQMVSDKVDRVLSMFEGIPAVLPCQACADHFKKWLQSLDVQTVRKPLALFYSTVDLHNQVNALLGKEAMTYEEALRVWGKPILKERRE